MAGDSLVARVFRLRAAVAGHKSAIHRHRKDLRAAAAELEQIEAECQRRGISLVIVPSTGTGDIHSHADRTS